MFFLINMHGSSHVGPWALECWKHSLEEKAGQDDRVVPGLVCSSNTAPWAWGTFSFPLLRLGHSMHSEGWMVVRVERVHQTLPLSMCGVCDVAMKAMPVCAWGPILSWQYALIKLVMMKNAELNSTEVKISPFSSDQSFPHFPHPHVSALSWKDHHFVSDVFNLCDSFSCWFNCWFFQWEC